MIASVGLAVSPAAASADGVPPTVTVPATVTVVGDRRAIVPVAIHDGGRAYSLCDWATCSAAVGAQIYDAAGKQVGIDVVSNSAKDRYLDEDLVVPVTLSPLVHDLPSGTYSVKVTTNAGDTYSGGQPPVVTTTTTTFTLDHVSEAKLALGRTVTKYKRHGWKIIGVLKKNGRAWTGAKVTIQVKIPSLGWSNILTKTTRAKGRVAFISEPGLGTGKVPARLLAKGPHGETCVSRTFSLYRR